jgi:FdhE protein
MDLQSIDTAIKAYTGSIQDADVARLAFFRGLWGIQQRRAEQVAAKAGAWHIDVAAAQAWYWDEKPFFLMAPPAIDTAELLDSLEECAGYLADEAGLCEEAAAQLKAYDWEELMSHVGTDAAGRDPVAWLGDAEARAFAADETLEAPVGAVLLSALRPLLEPVARATMDALPLADGRYAHAHPLRCPACGGHAAAGFVGPTPLSEGNGRLLYCAACGTSWEFERIRCAHCGTQNQNKLHYFHVEGDSAHRLHLCDECGSHLRTVFAEDMLAPLSFEVEDVLMAYLDHIVHINRPKANRIS